MDPAGVWHTRVHRTGGDPAAGLRQAGGLVGHGGHPVRVPAGLRAFLRRHARGALRTGHHRSDLREWGGGWSAWKTSGVTSR